MTQNAVIDFAMTFPLHTNYLLDNLKIKRLTGRMEYYGNKNPSGIKTFTGGLEIFNDIMIGYSFVE